MKCEHGNTVKVIYKDADLNSATLVGGLEARLEGCRECQEIEFRRVYRPKGNSFGRMQPVTREWSWLD